MEAAYGIGVHNRYALFLEDGDDDAGDPYALLTSVSAVTIEHGTGAGTIGAKKSTVPVANATGGARHPNQGPGSKSTGQAGMSSTVSGGAKSANHLASQNNNNKSSALSESKQNVAANQKDARQNRPRPAGAQQQQRPGGGIRENQENRAAQRSQRNFEPKDNDDLKPSKELRGEKFDNRRNGFVPRGGSRGRGGERGGRLGGKREFNRHSGNDRGGVKSTDKRDGGGQHNWGKIGDFNGDEQVLNGEKANGGAGTTVREDGKPIQGDDDGNDNGTVGGENETLGEDGEPKNDEPQLKTLDEYKRELEEKRVHTQFNIRKPGEGEDKSKWKKTYVLKKKPAAEEEEVEYEEIEVEDNKRRNRQVLDIEVNFRSADDGREVVRRGRGTGRNGPSGGNRRSDVDRPPRSGPAGDQMRPMGGDGGTSPGTGGGAGGSDIRGGGRGGGRGGPGARPGRGRERGRFQPAPKFDDPNDFPSLNP